MRKLLAFFMVLVLMGPVLSLLCACCPPAEASPVDSPVISGSDCSCCHETLQTKERENFQRERALLGISSLNRWLGSVLATVIPVIFESRGPLSSPAGSSPPFPSSSPLYLTLQILRI